MCSRKRGHTLATMRASLPHVAFCFIPPHSTSYLQPCDVAQKQHPSARLHRPCLVRHRQRIRHTVMSKAWQRQSASVWVLHAVVDLTRRGVCSRLRQCSADEFRDAVACSSQRVARPSCSRERSCLSPLWMSQWTGPRGKTLSSTTRSTASPSLGSSTCQQSQDPRNLPSPACIAPRLLYGRDPRCTFNGRGCWHRAPSPFGLWCLWSVQLGCSVAFCLRF